MHQGAPDDAAKTAPAATDNAAAAAAAARPPIAIPDHTLLRKIGGGSYGDVWLARHQMGMYRAVKFVSRKSFERREPFERELAGIRRFEPVSRSHEGFVDVLHVGINEDEGWFYYVMELGDDEVSGQAIQPEAYAPKTLATEIARRRSLPVRECLDLGLALSRALGELHRQNLVHRDIKPSNIIFVNGVPKLADIGLVADAAEARSFVGTQGFIPPEGPGSPQADIYSLGKVLYECCTGLDRQLFPELPASLHERPEADQLVELNLVILKACRPDVKERYQTAAEMHADLVVLERGESVKRLRTLERRWAKLKRGAAIGAVALAVLGIAGWQGYREWRRGIESRQQQVGANIALGTRAAESPDRLAALTYFAGAAQLDRGNVEREILHRLRFGAALEQCPKLEQMWFFDREINDAHLNPNGKDILVTEWEGSAHLVDFEGTAPGRLVTDTNQGLYRTAYSHDGTRFLTAGEDRSARLRTTTDGAVVRILEHPDKVLSVNFSPDDSRIVTGCRDGKVRIWDSRGGALVLEFAEHAGAILFAAYSPDGRLVVSTSRDSTARVWDSTNGLAICPPLSHPTWVGYADFDPLTHTVVTACYDHKARLWDIATGRRLLTDLKHRDGVSSAEFSPDGRYILTGSLDGNVRLWDLEDLSPESNLIMRHSGKVTSASFAPDGHHVLTAAADGSVRLWDLAGTMVAPICTRPSANANGTRFLVTTNNTFQVFDLLSGVPVSSPVTVGGSLEKAELSADGGFVIGTLQPEPGRPGRLLRVWEAASGRLPGEGILLTSPPSRVCLSPGGRRLVICDAEVARIWDVSRAKPLSDPLRHQKPVGFCCFSPEESHVVTVSSNVVHVWDAAAGRAAFAPIVHSVGVSHVAFSPDGSLFVTSTADDQFRPCSARVWNTATGQAAGPPLNHGDGVLQANFSPDGRFVATASEDFTAVVWETATGNQVTPPLHHGHHVYSVVFSSDSRWLLTTSPDGTARVWSTETGDPLTPPLRHPDMIANGVFLPDDRHVVTFGMSRGVWVWDLPIDQRPVEDLIQLERLLSGDKRSNPQEWARLRRQYPADFLASPGETGTWHEWEALADEGRGRWFAAAFHWTQLSAIRTNDASVAKHLARARSHLAKPD